MAVRRACATHAHAGGRILSCVGPRPGPRSDCVALGHRAATGVLIDRDLANALGWQDATAAIGQPLYRGESSGANEIIGVTENLPWSLRSGNVTGTVYYLAPESARWTLIRLDRSRVEAALAHIDDAVRSLAPGRPPAQRVFLDEAFDEAYRTFTLINRVLIGLAVFAFVISGIGLYALAGYMTARRTREIGLRKAQGASSMQVLRLLLWSFTKPVLAANLLMWPLVIISADRYLEFFAVRDATTVLPFGAALAGTLTIAWLAVGAHAIRAAYLKPAEALRYG